MAQSKLCQYFSMIRSREQILLEIRSDPALNARFEALSEEAQKEFLDICTGEKGVKILYDSFFRSVMNPELYPDRLQSMLSCILGMEIASFHVLETSSFALGDVKSLVIMDIVVELLDGSIINLEVQKIGYDFPGERAACYASDLTLRQYARARRDAAKRSAEEPGHKFSYHAIHPVYTIVLIEKSPSLFYRFPDQYIHRFSQKSDTGLSMELLHNYIFIPLDIFRKKHQNEDISTELDAWLTFLIYEICQNTEDVMGIFSEALAELDRNTVDYMIDKLKRSNEQLQGEKEQLQGEKKQLQDENTRLKEELDNMRKQLREQK